MVVCLCVRLCFSSCSEVVGSKLGMGVGDGAPEAQEHIFEVTILKVKGHPGVNLPWKCPIATKFDRKNS